MIPAESDPSSKGANGFWKDYNDGSADGSQVARGVLVEAVETLPDGTVRMLGMDAVGGVPTATAFVSGTFRTVDLIGLDAAAVVDLGRIVAGVPGTLTDPSTILRIG